MSEFEDKLSQLQTRLKHLETYEAAFKREIADIRREIGLLKTDSNLNRKELERSSYTKPIEKTEIPKQNTQSPINPPKIEHKEQQQERPKQTTTVPNFEPVKSSISIQAQNNLEKFIGENLISKIGIIVLIIGVAIGAKYAIDNNWITPLMRIVFGYLVGLSLIGLALKLKAKYHNYSSVLLSGGIAIMYFITYFAYNYYALLSQLSAFSLMVIFTIFTVIAAIIYNAQIIAHLGLVGAYAIPFLLSDGSGRYDILFSYIAIINVGILAVSVHKYWKPIFYTSFLVTWFVYTGWYFSKFDYSQHFTLGFTFLFLFFLTFYLTFLAYKLFQDEPFQPENIFLILLNSFIFYGFGYAILSYENAEQLLSLFTLLNALIHFIIGFVIHRFKLGDKTIFYLTVSLVLTFLTIFVPIQFDGNWITILWMAQAVFLYVIGRTKKITLLEYFSYPILTLAGVSLLVDWFSVSNSKPVQIADAIYPIFNRDFLTTLFVALGLGIIFYINRDKRYETPLDDSLKQVINIAIPTALLIVTYNLFRIEIGNYYEYLELKTAIQPTETTDYSDQIKNDSLQLFNAVWQINYTVLFLTILSFINIKTFRNVVFGFVNLTLNAFAVTVFLSVSLLILSYLGDLYLNPVQNAGFEASVYNIFIRYISFAFVGCLFIASYLYIKQKFITDNISSKHLLIAFDTSLYFTLLVILSSEIINWADIIDIKEIYRLGLTIFFGLYAVGLIVLGIIQKKKHLRLFAIVLFAITLAKLFLYDIAELNTVSKTVVFVSVGILLLIASFLYTKYKDIIFGEEII